MKEEEVTMDTVDLIIESATTFYNDLKADKNGRYRSWEHYYKCFHDARSNSNPDYDYLSLQLAFYLASWGMYRGSSFLLQKDYKVHNPVVEEILKEEYNYLFSIECIELRKKNPSEPKKIGKVHGVSIRQYSYECKGIGCEKQALYHSDNKDTQGNAGMCSGL